MKRQKPLGVIVGCLLVVLALSGCNLRQIERFQQQTGLVFGAEEQSDLIDLPDYSPGQCIWVETGLRARGFNEDAIRKSVKYALRESMCCPERTGGDNVDDSCHPTGKNNAWRYDPTDTGVMQFNGYRPTGGVKAQSPALGFCNEGVRRFLNEQWSDVVTFPCNQWDVTADPELQLDMLYKIIVECGFGPWQPVNGRYRCQSYNPLVG